MKLLSTLLGDVQLTHFMQTASKIGRLLLIAALGSVTTMTTASRTHAGESCHKVKAKGFGEDFGYGKTAAVIIGGGLLHGATMASFEITSLSGNVASIAGSVKFLSNRGTVTIGITGTFDVVSGAFSASGPVIASTGKLAGATGSLRLTGVEDFTDGTFVEDISGTICADLSP